MLPNPFYKAASILSMLESYGHEGYFVGGCVRDFLLQRNIHDIDIATSATPTEVKQIFPKVIPVGIEHGTVIIRYEEESYEVTTYRVEGDYSDRRHPDEVQFVRNLDEDLRRRDFTINALAMNKSGEIIDLFHGQKDLDNGFIRTVGNGKERFQEDALRIIRALRFSSQLGFDIEENTLIAMQLLRSEINHLAVERLTTELTKLFQGRYVKKSIQYFIDLHIDQQLPVFQDGYTHLLKTIHRNLIPLHSFGEVISVLHLQEPDISIIDWVKGYKCSNIIKNEAIQLTNVYRYYKTQRIDRWLVYQLPRSLWMGWTRIVNVLDNTNIHIDQLEDMEKELPIKNRADLAINGNDLLEWFPHREKGRWLKEILQEIEYLVVSMHLKNDNSTIKEWVLCNRPEQS